MAGSIHLFSIPGALPAVPLPAGRADAWEKLVLYGVLLLAVLAMMAAVALFVKRNYLGSTGEQGPTTSDLLSNFRELYSQGELSDEEYRTIKTKLTARFQKELTDPELKDAELKKTGSNDRELKNTQRRDTGAEDSGVQEELREGSPRAWRKDS